MYSSSDIEKAIYDWIYSVVNPAGTTIPAPIMWENQDAPRPEVAYISLLIPTQIPRGVDYLQLPNSLGISNAVGNRDFTLHIQAIGGSNSFDRCKLISNSMELPTVQENLRKANIAFVDKFPIMNISETIDTRWEIRHAFDCILRYADESTNNVGLIESVSIEGTTITPSLHTITITNII